MKVELLVSRAGLTVCENVGDIIDVSDAEAARMIEAGQAKPARVSSKETTSKKNSKAEKANKG
ncbi:MAG: hypothetical protein R3332_00430 [Pseudohongiellaceae bacterium]|nr:hypothetical protein [Pseudohongiellaceae bacterium]